MEMDTDGMGGWDVVVIIVVVVESPIMGNRADPKIRSKACFWHTSFVHVWDRLVTILADTREFLHMTNRPACDPSTQDPQTGELTQIRLYFEIIHF